MRLSPVRRRTVPSVRRTRSSHPWFALIVVVGYGLGSLGTAQPAPIDLERAWVEGRPAAVARCLIPGDESLDTAFHTRLADLFGRLAQDRIGALLLDSAGRAQVAVCLDDRNTGCRGAYAFEEGVIVVDERLDEDDLILVLVHELRHFDRAMHGFRVPVQAHVDAARTLVCASEADAEAVATLVAWRLHTSGRSGPWSALRRDPRYGDIADTFDAALRLGAGDLQATHVAFLRWYASTWRVTTYQRAAAMAHLDRIDELHLLPGDERLPEGRFEALGALPDGRSYDARPASSAPCVQREN